jgi:predicted nucleotidyltransferase
LEDAIKQKEINNKPSTKLLYLLKEKLKTIPEIKKIYTFGKIVTGKTDKFSDVDIIIVADDLLSTYEKTIDLINEISKIKETYIIKSTENKIAETYILDGYSPYQKIDLSVENDSNSIFFEPKELIYENKNTTVFPKTLLPIKNIYSFENQFKDLLFAISRFLKSVHRNDITVYRRWEQTLNNFWYYLYITYVGEKGFNNKKINPKEFDDIFASIPDELKNNIFTYLPLDGRLNIIDAYPELILKMIKINKMNLMYQDVNDDFTNFMIKFMNHELKIIKDNINRTLKRGDI